VQRHLEWHSPSTALVSEPLDHVSVSYDTPDFSRGASGFLGADSTTSRLVLDQLVTLAPSVTYSVLVRHQGDNSVEERTVSTGAGDWGAVTLSSPLSTAPAEGDIYVVGVVGSSIMHLIVESVEQSDDLTYRLAASEYVSEVYSFPTPPSPPYVPPTPPPPGPAPGSQAPNAPTLYAVFVYPGTIKLAWNYGPITVPFDFYTNAQIFFSPFDTDHFELYHDMGGAYGEYEEFTTQLRDGYFAVRVQSDLGGWSALSGSWHTDWQGGGGGSE
jgi:hypothetical protein